MKNKRFLKCLSFILCSVLIAAIALFVIGCKDNKTDINSQLTETSTVNNGTSADKVLGEGATSFKLCVVDANKKETSFTINTDKKTVGEALLELDLIAGDMGDYGLYIKTVNGITVDYDKDGKYWAFYINGEYAVSGVDTTDIIAGNTYSLKVE